MIVLFCGLILLNAHLGLAQESDKSEQKNQIEEQVQSVHQLLEQGLYVKAVESLTALLAKSETENQKATISFMLGRAFFLQQKYPEAKIYLEMAANAKLQAEDAVRLLLAQSYVAMGSLLEAKRELHLVLSLKPNVKIKNDAKWELAQISIKLGEWQVAKTHLYYLEKQLRSAPHYVDVLWQLITVENQLRMQWKSCRWAKTLYQKHSAHPRIAHWGVDLQKAQHEGKALGCIATFAEQKKRWRNLQLSGLADRARAEILQLKSQARDKAIYHIDTAYAQFLVNEGLVDEALTLLAKYYDERQNEFEYLQILGTAAARSGAFQIAVGAYSKANELQPRSQKGRRALFQAAFLSYQFQDYDGATRKFEQFIKRYGVSGLSRDAKWYLAWMQYLKGNYSVAYGQLKDLRWKKFRRRKVSDQRIVYWMAMSLMKMGKKQEARPLFTELAQYKDYGYYSVASNYRIRQMARDAQEAARILAMEEKNPKAASNDLFDELEALQNERLVQSSGESIETIPLDNASEDISPTNLSEEMESEDNMQVDVAGGEDSEESSDEADGAELTASTEKESVDPDDMVVVSDFKNPALARRFETARELIFMGQADLAVWELYEIERRTRDKTYLRILMGEYESIGRYNRSSYIGQIQFGGQRLKYGIKGVRHLWESTYPQAYESFVKDNSKKSGIPYELTWSIMRAESHYRPDVRSPVGAVGLMQLMPNTANQMANLIGKKGFQVERLIEPQTNIILGTRYLGRLMKKFESSIPLVAAGYNAGPHRVESWIKSFGRIDMDEFIEHIPFLETRNYVKKVVSNYQVYKHLYSNEVDSLKWLVRPVGFELEGSPSVRETWEPI